MEKYEKRNRLMGSSLGEASAHYVIDEARMLHNSHLDGDEASFGESRIIFNRNSSMGTCNEESMARVRLVEARKKPEKKQAGTIMTHYKNQGLKFQEGLHSARPSDRTIDWPTVTEREMVS